MTFLKRDGKRGWQFYKGDDFDCFYFRGDAIHLHPPLTQVLPVVHLSTAKMLTSTLLKHLSTQPGLST